MASADWPMDATHFGPFLCARQESGPGGSVLNDPGPYTAGGAKGMGTPHRGESRHPSDLSPSPATTSYHTKVTSVSTRGGKDAGRGLRNPTRKWWAEKGSKTRPIIADGGQDRAHALGWGSATQPT